MSARPVLHTPICDTLGIEYPIMLAGMGPVAHEELAAAVSNAGGLGVLGRSTTYSRALTNKELRDRIRRMRDLTDKPFGVDLVLPVAMVAADSTEMASTTPQTHKDFIEQLRIEAGLPVLPPEEGIEVQPWANIDVLRGQLMVLAEERVPVFASGLGLAEWAVPICREAGMKIIALVGNVKNARRVVKTGADIVGAQGYDAGGHTGRVGNFSLIPQAVDAVSPVPVVAAGGIVDGRGLAAALALGAVGAWCGTAFLATKESPMTAGAKKKILEMTEEGTVISKAVSGKTARLIPNRYVQAWDKGTLAPLPFPYQFELSRELRRAANLAGASEYEPIAAGQGGGLVKEIRPAAEVVRDMVELAVEILAKMSQRVEFSAH